MKKIAVIGAGIGGLTVANLLQKKGHQVTLFEAHSIPGGYTGGFRRQGFYFESGTLSLEDGQILFKTLKELGVLEKLTFLPQTIRIVSKDFDAIPKSYDELKKMILEAYPEKKAAWVAFFSSIDRMIYSFSKPSFFNLLVMIYYLVRYRNISLDSRVHQFFKEDPFSEHIASSLSFGYSNSPLWMSGFALSSLFSDYWTLKGGMQNLADVLSDNFKSLKGELRLKTKVEKIITKEGRAVGVLAKGISENFDVIVSACDYKKTFLNLLDDTSRIDKEKIEKAEVSESFFVTYLGLNIPPSELKKNLKCHYVHYITQSTSWSSLIKEPTSILLYSSSILDSTLAPEGKSSLMVILPLGAKYKDYFFDKETYKERKKKLEEELLNLTSTLLPDVSKWIILKDSATPKTFEKFTQNSLGATAGWSWDVSKKFYKGMSFMTHVETPIKKLYLSSMWAGTIGGIPTALNAAKKCFKKINNL